MAIREIVKMGAPVLNEFASAVSDEEFQTVDSILLDMEDTMRAAGGIGIAAPQIGIAKKIIMFGFETSERYPGRAPVPWTVLINPEFRIIDETLDYAWEGCLSVPGIRGYVPRYRSIHYKGLAPSGELIDRTVEGFHARVFQHEYDHLIGTLFIHHVKDKSMMGFEDELKKNNRY